MEKIAEPAGVTFAAGWGMPEIESCGLISPVRNVFYPALMNRLPIRLLFLLAPLASAEAAEITVEGRPFTVERTAAGTVLPTGETVLLRLDPKSWQEFEITEVADHGAKVAKGDVLVRFQTETIDRKLEDARRALATGALNLAQAELDLKDLVETSPHRLEAYRRAAEIAREENSYFVKTRRKATEEGAEQSLKRSRQTLENQQEELKQLTQMYAADDITEETEEIILTRQKNAVAAAEFSLQMEELDHRRTLDVTLPREAVELANAERDTAIRLRKAEQDIPRSIELKKIEVEGLRSSHEREKQTLAELEHDRAMFEFKAPADGWFHHGAIENGRWTTGDAVKSLVVHGKPPLNRAYASFVPASSSWGITAFLDEAAARSLKKDVVGVAALAGREDLEISVKLASLATTPGPEGNYRADFAATWPKEATPVAGSTAQIRLIAYHQPAAIAIPSKALAFGIDGWTAEVKLADGKSERRPVKRGRISGEMVEILSGLEAGQVVIDPSAPAK